MGKMWKYEPEDFGDKKDHLKGKQFKTDPKYFKIAITMDHEVDNDGNPIFAEKPETVQQYGKRTGTNAWMLKNEHKF